MSTEVQVTPEPILRLASGFMAAKHLFAANEAGLFQALGTGPAQLEELAHRTGLPARTARITADAMVALGLLEVEGGHYRNAPVAAAFLAGGGGPDLRPMLRFWDQISYPAWTGLADSIRRGHSAAGPLPAELQPVFSDGVEAFTAGTAAALATGYDFGRHHRLLDLGGGTGSFLLAILRRHPSLAATLMELPAVAELARRHLAETIFARQIDVVPGDVFRDAVPAGHDAVLMANVAHLFSPERNRALLERIHPCVPAGARLLWVDFWTDPTHTQPPLGALMAGEFLLAAEEGDVYSADEATAWLEATGWRAVDQRPLTPAASLLVAERR